MARMGDTRLSKCVMFGELVRGVGCVEGREKEWMGCFLCSGSDNFQCFSRMGMHSRSYLSGSAA